MLVDIEEQEKVTLHEAVECADDDNKARLLYALDRMSEKVYPIGLSTTDDEIGELLVARQEFLTDKLLSIVDVMLNGALSVDKVREIINGELRNNMSKIQ